MDPVHLAVYRSFNAHRVRYILIGGPAAVFYGFPRVTKDVDLFIEPALANATRALRALEAAGFGTAALTTPEQPLAHEVTIFKDVMRLDLLTAVKGVSSPMVWRRRVTKRIEGVRVPVIQLDDLITAKKAAGRGIDLEDVKV